jgi:uncharacterized membrane protein
VARLKLGMSRPLIGAGLTTLLAVAAKLFLIDLSYVGVLWRIFLFLGFGAAFLLFSYYLSGAMRRNGSNDQEVNNARDALSV